MAFRSAANADTGNVTSITINKPTGATTDDILIALIICTDSGGTITSTGSAFTQIGSWSDSSSRRCQIWYRVVVSGDSGTSSWTWSKSPSGFWAGAIAAFSGRSTSAPIDNAGASWSTNGSNSGTTAATVTKTTAADGCDVVLLYGRTTNFGDGTWTCGDGTYTERFDGGSSIAIYSKEQASAGAVGAITGTCTTGPPQCAMMVALAPAAGGGGGSAFPHYYYQQMRR